MLVSVVVRTFAGRELLLARALESIRAQNNKDYTIQTVVAVDGKPIDEERANLSRFDNVSVVAADPPGGRSAAANAGLEATSGDLVGFLDDDDWFEPNHVGVLTRLLDANPDAAAAYAAAWQQEGRLDVRDPERSILGERTLYYRRMRNSLDLLKKNHFPIQSVLFRRACLAKSEARFSTTLNALEDWLFWQQLLIGERVVSTEEVTSTFIVPLEREEQERRSDAHRRAIPQMRALQRSIRVPLIAFHDLAQAKDSSRGQPQTGKAFPANWRNLLAARLRLLKRNRPKFRHRVEYAFLRAARELGRRVSPDGPETEKEKRKRSAINAGKGHGSTREAPPPPGIPMPVIVPSLQSRFERSDAVRRRTSNTAVFTSCTWAQMDRALVLAESVAKQMQKVDFHILLVDTPRNDRPLPSTVARLFPCADLRDFTPAWAFKHTVVELSTAVKPLYTDVLLDEGYEQVVYFDPDTMLLSTPLSLEEDLRRGDFLLTPHLHRPAVSQLATETFEIAALARGVYNLGFFALKNTPRAREVVSHWGARCLRYGYDEVHLGIFNDQKWANHFPVFFGATVVVSTNPGLNTAVWNADGRSITRNAETYFIDGVPIEMFHFSGWDAGNPDRFGSDILGTVSGAELLAAYTDSMARYERFRDRFWPYAYFDDGAKIEKPHRLVYRRDPSMEAAYPNPFMSGPGTFQAHAADNWEAVCRRYDESKFVRRHL